MSETVIDALTGADFTVKINDTDYSAIVIDGGLTKAPNVLTTTTLRGKARAQTDVTRTGDLNILYDEDGGLYAALEAASDDGDDIEVLIIGGSGQWSGEHVKITNLGVSYAGEAHSTCSVSIEGDMDFTPVTP
ncbi:hypothetical protein [uncultured Microbacterium sp.]|uniref:hypothetical protein n=1 Tax=uncultured Microbacterium sp. TaxID=191216 RepID=UPI0025E69CAC|nr:hypothetical protein [uncultured Microbacterium sp.]